MPTRIPLDAVFAASPNAYMLVDQELRYVAANAAYLASTHSKLEDILGRKVTDAFPHDPDDPANEFARRLEASLRRVLETGKSDVLALIPYRIQTTHDGVTRYEDHEWSATHTPIFDVEGRVEFVLQHTVDVTELRGRGGREHDGDVAKTAGVLARAETAEAQKAALDSSLRELRRIFEQSPGFMCFLRGPDFVFELANAAYMQLVGHRDIVGKPLREALPEMAGQGFIEILENVIATGQPYVGSGVLVKVQRTPGAELEDRFVDFVYQPTWGPDGRCLGVIAHGVDITQQTIAEGAIRAALADSHHARAELEAIFESFPEALYVSDGKSITRANRGALDLLGLDSLGELQGDIGRLVRALDVRGADGKAIASGETPAARAARGERVQMEAIVRHGKLKQDRLVRSAAAPIRVGDRITGSVITHTDMTTRHRAEEELRRFANVLDATRDFVGIADLQGKPLFVNEAGRRMVGLPIGEALDHVRVVEFFASEQHEIVMNVVVPQALRGEYWSGELSFRHFVTGESIPVLYSVFPLRDSRGDVSAIATITRDLRAQKAAEAERARLLENERTARAQAEAANRTKDEFLATVSHELRTPLTSMLGWVRMLRTGMLPEAKRASALETVERNARAQAQLIEDLLDVSRIVSGKLALEMEPVDALGVVSGAVETIRPTADAKRVQLHVAMEATGVVLGDSQRLQQVVWNLLANAVKFTPSGGRVEARTRRVGEMLEIAVSDTGCGIAPSFLPHVFERFKQDGDGSVRRGGLGLGLSIARHIVEVHGGTIRAESEGEGRGARFVVRIPLLGTSTRFRDDTVDASTDDWRDAHALAGLHVLVVDDEADTREYVRSVLEQCRIRVTDAPSVDAALNSFRDDRPDLIVSDIGMPGADGYSLINSIRAFAPSDGGKTPAVALTAYAQPSDRARALRSGYQNHVTKPVEPGELIAVVASLVR